MLVSWRVASFFRPRGNVRGFAHTKAEKTEKMDVQCLKLEHTQNDARHILKPERHFCKSIMFLVDIFWISHFFLKKIGGVDGVIICFFHWWTPWTNLCCERFIGAHRLHPTGFGSHFRWLGRVIQPIFIWFFKTPKANHRFRMYENRFENSLRNNGEFIYQQTNWCIF